MANHGGNKSFRKAGGLVFFSHILYVSALQLDTTKVIYPGIMSNYMHYSVLAPGLKFFYIIWHLLMNVFLWSLTDAICIALPESVNKER